ncbi:hypothetical protein [Paratractidigestivibacter faecalis]|uniref:hypothetical protein n=1 Tax=Paratractidigestivibacter faecalis TaxID=2292441 RepID=UPI0018E538E3|nr:hypothetical protein [Paratractidigestivibacter faecalis]
MSTPVPAMLGGDAGDGGARAGENADNAKYKATLLREREWRRLNPRLWSEIEAWALAEAAAGRKFAMQTALERVRWKDYANDEGNPTKVPNDFGAIWARLLVATHPEVRPFVTMRPSVYDGFEVR